MSSIAYARPKTIRRRWSAGRVIGWTVGGVVIVGMAISVLLPSLCRAREPANKIKCSSNLRVIGAAIADYARDNGGQYPPTLATLVKRGDIEPNGLVCPSSNDAMAAPGRPADAVAEIEAAEANAPGHQHCLSYVYVGRGLTAATAAATTVVAYEPLTNHNGEGGNVLFGDGRVEFVVKHEWPNVVGAGAAGATPTRK